MARHAWRAALLVAVLVGVAAASKCPGTPNTIPINDKEPVLQRTVPNGKRYLAGQGNDTFYVVHVFGTPTEMGTAYGTLFREELPEQINNFDEYIENMLTKALPWLPSWVADIIVQYGAGYLLELTFNGTAPFTQKRYIEELDAISQAAGLNPWKLRALSQFPEAIKAACTIVGANGAATNRSTLAGGIAHLRGLDFGVHPNIKNFPTVTVYHPSDGSPVVANFGWLAFTGSLTAMSNTVIGLGEKVWDKSPIWNGSLWGEAWTFVNREVMRARNMDEAIATLDASKRTCGIHLGVGDSTTNTFRGFEVNAKVVRIFNDTSIAPYPQHPTLPGIVYWDKYAQPTHSYCLSSLLNANYGKIDAKFLATTVASSLQTGDIHSAAFDYVSQIAYFANARKTYDPNGEDPAYARQWTRLDMKRLFMESPPMQ